MVFILRVISRLVSSARRSMFCYKTNQKLKMSVYNNFKAYSHYVDESN